jgi:hypothetical protein
MSPYTHNMVSTTVLHCVASSTSCRLTLDWNAFLIYLTSGLIRSVRYILFPGPCNDKPFALLLLSVCFSHLWCVKFQSVKYILQKHRLPKVNYFHFARCEVLTAVLLKVQAFLLFGAWFPTFPSSPRIVGLINPKYEGIMLCWTSGTAWPKTQHHIPEEWHFIFSLANVCPLADSSLSFVKFMYMCCTELIWHNSVPSFHCVRKCNSHLSHCHLISILIELGLKFGMCKKPVYRKCHINKIHNYKMHNTQQNKKCYITSYYWNIVTHDLNTKCSDVVCSTRLSKFSCAIAVAYGSVSQPLSDRGPVKYFFIRRGPSPNKFTHK